MPINNIKGGLAQAIPPKTPEKITKSFKEVLDNKIQKKPDLLDAARVMLKESINQISNEHKIAMHKISNSMGKKNLTAEELLRFQFDTGTWLVRQQAVTKTAELSANTFNQLVRMQI